MVVGIKQIVVFLLAIVPAVVWLWLFLSKHRENKWLVVLTFIGGMIAAKIILVYQGYWDETINFIYFKVSLVDFRSNIESMIANTTLALFVVFLGVGAMEEFLKFGVMKLIDDGLFKSIDDVIELAIVSALGFAFYENIIYFFANWGQLSAGGFFAFAIMRVTITTMIHVLSSGVLGYYYGMAYFASPMLMIQYMKKKTHPILKFFKQVLHLRKDYVYHNEMLLIGLVLAMVLHGTYNFILAINAKILGIPLFIPVLLIYFFGGYAFLDKLLKRKNLNLKMGLVGTDAMPKQDFEKLLKQVQEIKDKMRNEETDQVPTV